jgi:hypothetical protein
MSAFTNKSTTSNNCNVKNDKSSPILYNSNTLNTYSSLLGSLGYNK